MFSGSASPFVPFRRSCAPSLGAQVSLGSAPPPARVTSRSRRPHLPVSTHCRLRFATPRRAAPRHIKKKMLDVVLFRADQGGNPDLVRESQKRRYADVGLVDKVIALDTEWRESECCRLARQGAPLCELHLHCIPLRTCGAHCVLTCRARTASPARISARRAHAAA